MDAEPKSKDPADDPLALGLGVRERWVASVIGVAGVGVGGAGIFLSDNQAGTTAILLLGAVFLLMGVQGTAIIKAGKDSVELERRRASRKLTKQAVEAIETRDNPREAAAFIDKARAVDPSLLDDPSFSYLNVRIQEELRTYDAIRNALESLLRSDMVRLPAGTVMDFYPDRDTKTGMQYDALLTLPGQGNLIIEVKCERQPPPWIDINEPLNSQMLFIVLDELLRSLRVHSTSKALMVVNIEPKFLRNSAAGFEDRLEIVKWTDPSHNKDLVTALERLIGPNEING